MKNRPELGPISMGSWRRDTPIHSLDLAEANISLMHRMGVRAPADCDHVSSGLCGFGRTQINSFDTKGNTRARSHHLLQRQEARAKALILPATSSKFSASLRIDACIGCPPGLDDCYFAINALAAPGDAASAQVVRGACNRVVCGCHFRRCNCVEDAEEPAERNKDTGHLAQACTREEARGARA